MSLLKPGLLLVFLISLSCQAQKEKEFKDSLFKKAYHKYKLLDYKGAYADYSQYLNKHSASSVCMYYRSLCSVKLNDYKNAINDLSKGLSIRRDVRFFYTRGYCYYVLDNLEPASADLDSALRINPDHNGALTHKAAILNRANKYEEALVLLNRSCKIDSTFDQSYSFRAMANFYVGNFEASIADCNTLMRMTPTNEVLYLRGLNYKSLEQYDKAVADFDSVLHMDPKHSGSYFNRGASYTKLGKYEEALSDYDKFMKLSPNYYDAYFNRGIIKYGLEKYKEAEADFNAAMAIRNTTSNDVRLYCYRGINYYELAKYKLALSDLNQALAIEKKYEAYVYRANTRYQLKDSVGADKDYEEAIAMNEKHALVYRERGMAYHKHGKHAMALADLDKAITLHNDDGWLYYYRAKIKKGMKDSAGACADFKKAKELDCTEKDLPQQLKATGCK